MTKKTRFINKLVALSEKEKITLIAFFSANPVFENRINWNNKNLKYEDFEDVFSLSRTSRKNRNNTIKMFKYHNCKIIACTKEFAIVVPLDWYCAKFLNSFECGGEGARWCIGSKSSNTHWNYEMDRGVVFYFLYFFERHPVFGKKIMIEIDDENKRCFYTQNDGRHAFDLLANYLCDKI